MVGSLVVNWLQMEPFVSHVSCVFVCACMSLCVCASSATMGFVFCMSARQSCSGVPVGC